VPQSFATPSAPGRRRATFLIAAALTAIGGVGAFELSGATPTPALTPPVAAAAAHHPGRGLRVIVQQSPGADVRAAIRAQGATVERSIDLIHGLAVRATAAGAARIARLPGVSAVSLDAPVRGASAPPDDTALGSAYNASIRSGVAWSRGYTGRGVGVAVIDTGIRGDLPDFQVSDTDHSSRVVASAVVNPGASTADDAYGHGTHVAGLIAGNGLDRPAGDPLRGKYSGVAPDARLISVKAGDEQGNATVLDVIDGLQFVVDHRADLGIRVVNLSLSSSVAESAATDPLDAAVESAWLKGIVVVAAAGNRGNASDAVQYAPANDPWVISVGAVNDKATKGIEDDVLSSWSSRGTTQDGFAKPDVLAPGAHLVSTIPAGAAYQQQCPQCQVDGSYFRVGGTSMAAAVVSGAVADVLAAHPDWTPGQVKAALVKKSRPVENQVTTDGIVVDGSGDALPAGTTVYSTVVGGELAIDKIINGYSNTAPPPANAGLPVNTFVSPATGDIDYTRTSWTRTSWTAAADPLRTSWTQSDWMRTSWTRTSWTASESACADLERTSWTRTSWTADDIASARADCDALLASVDPTRTSWTRTSWTRTSWTSSFDK
jgi:serine protease AprX